MKTKSIALVILALIIVLVGYFWWSSSKGQSPTKTATEPAQNNNLTILSTNPTSLEGATISPTQPIEITFSKPISISQFKYKLDPTLEHDAASTSGDNSFGTTFRISFKKPLELGAAFTLTISPETKVNDQQKLDKEYIYHIKTIGYKGA